VLNEGDRVPADGWVAQGDGLPFIYSGALVVGGWGLAFVTATGTSSQIGQVLATIEPTAPGLQRQMRRLVWWFAALGGSASVLALVLYGLLRGGWVKAALAGIALGMAMLPEEFPVVLTVFMAMGAMRMTRARVLTRRASAIETLGSVRHWDAMKSSKDKNGRSLYSDHLDRALRLASLTGLRLGDLVRVTWEDVGDNAIILTTRKRKGRAIIPILPDLRGLLDSIGAGTGPILRNSRGEPWTESGLGSVFQKAKPTGFDRTMHDLRGTYATWLAMRGLTDEEIARTIGWTAKRISEIRSRYVDEARVIVSMVERLSA
jgi:hypothetical protein